MTERDLNLDSILHHNLRQRQRFRLGLSFISGGLQKDKTYPRVPVSDFLDLLHIQVGDIAHETLVELEKAAVVGILRGRGKNGLLN